MLASILRPVRLAQGWGLVRTVRDEEGAPVRVLQVGGVYQSATYLDERRMEPAFSYYRAFDYAFSVRPVTKHLLMVGGGGYAWPKHVLATQPGDVVMDVVELDPAVTRVARRWFFLNEAMSAHPGRLRLIEDDGRSYLDGRALRVASDACAEPHAPGEPGASSVPALPDSPPRDALLYDAIVLDAFVGCEPVRSLATVEAARSARGCLVPDGLLLANVVSADGGANVSFLRDVVATWREAFAHVYVVLCEEEPLAVEDNYLVIATNGSWPVADSIPYEDEFPGEVFRDEA